MLAAQGRGGEGEGHPTFVPNVIYIIAVGYVIFVGHGLGLGALGSSRR